MYNASFGFRKRPLSGFGDKAYPYSMYHAPGQNYYYMDGDFYGLGQEGEEAIVEEGAAPVEVPEEIVPETGPAGWTKAQRRSIALSAIRGGTGLLATGALIYVHRKRDIGWYCTILGSLVFGGLIAGAVSGVTGAIWNAADPIPIEEGA